MDNTTHLFEHFGGTGVGPESLPGATKPPFDAPGKTTDNLPVGPVLAARLQRRAPLRVVAHRGDHRRLALQELRGERHLEPVVAQHAPRLPHARHPAPGKLGVVVAHGADAGEHRAGARAQPVDVAPRRLALDEERCRAREDEEIVEIAPLGRQQRGRAQQAANVMPDLARAMKYNPDLKVMLNSGYFDLATPYYEGIYEMQHLPMPDNLQKNIEIKFYHSGHMVYAHQASLKELHDNVAAFIHKGGAAQPLK